jgi:hypothetical protein
VLGCATNRNQAGALLGQEKFAGSYRRDHFLADTSTDTLSFKASRTDTKIAEVADFIGVSVLHLLG